MARSIPFYADSSPHKCDSPMHLLHRPREKLWAVSPFGELPFSLQQLFPKPFTTEYSCPSRLYQVFYDVLEQNSKTYYEPLYFYHYLHKNAIENLLFCNSNDITIIKMVADSINIRDQTSYETEELQNEHHRNTKCARRHRTIFSRL